MAVNLRKRRTREEVYRDERSLFTLDQLKRKISDFSSYKLLIVFQYPLSYKVIKQRSFAFFLPMYAEYCLLADFYTGTMLLTDESSISLDFVLVGPYSETIIKSIPLCVLHQ